VLETLNPAQSINQHPVGFSGNPGFTGMRILHCNFDIFELTSIGLRCQEV